MSRFTDFLDSMHIALEADDITQETQAEVRSAIGGALPTDTQDSETNNEDLMQVDNIFDKPLEESQDDPSGNPEQDQKDGANPSNLGEDSQSDDGTKTNPEGDAGENAQTDPNLSEDPNGNNEDGSTGGQNEEDLLFAKKNRIRDNLIQLYTIISSDIEILVNSISTINDRSTIEVVNNVLGHLRNSKSFLYKTLTQNLTQLEYDELLQRYVTVRRVYDICIQMLRKYFDENSKLGNAIK